MADPGAAVEVHGAVAVKGAVATDDPEVVVAQIERTRDDLARTIDSLAERVSPAHNIRMLREKLAEQVSKPEVQIGAAALGIAVVGVTILWLSRHRRSR